MWICAISSYHFELFSSFLEWVVEVSGLDSLLHYLDDFLFVGPVDGDQCRLLLSGYLRAAWCPIICQDKTKGPVLSFLGIEIDTVQMVYRLPRDKLARLPSLFHLAWGARKIQLK